MVNYVKRLIYVDNTETVKISPLFYPFLFTTFVYGLGFAFFGFWSGVSKSSLFQAFVLLHPWLPAIWGAVAIGAGMLAFILLITRHRGFGEPASMLGVLVWLFAGITYILNGYWLVVLTVAVPNLYFWVFYYFRVRNYQREKNAGRLVDPS